MAAIQSPSFQTTLNRYIYLIVSCTALIQSPGEIYFAASSSERICANAFSMLSAQSSAVIFPFTTSPAGFQSSLVRSILLPCAWVSKAGTTATTPSSLNTWYMLYMLSEMESFTISVAVFVASTAFAFSPKSFTESSV